MRSGLTCIISQKWVKVMTLVCPLFWLFNALLWALTRVRWKWDFWRRTHPRMHCTGTPHERVSFCRRDMYERIARKQSSHVVIHIAGCIGQHVVRWNGKFGVDRACRKKHTAVIRAQIARVSGGGGGGGAFLVLRSQDGERRAPERAGELPIYIIGKKRYFLDIPWIAYHISLIVLVFKFLLSPCPPPPPLFFRFSVFQTFSTNCFLKTGIFHQYQSISKIFPAKQVTYRKSAVIGPHMFSLSGISNIHIFTCWVYKYTYMDYIHGGYAVNK